MKCIYQISCVDTNIDEIYIGSTENFKERIKVHKKAYNSNIKYKVYEFIRANGGLSNWDITPIEEIDFPISKLELRQYEQGYLDKYKPQLNSQRAYRTEEQKKEQRYKHSKEWRNNNKEHISIKNKEYNEKNKEQISIQKKEFYENNKEQISIKRKQKVNCPHCSKEMRKDNIKRHIKRKHPTLF